MTDSSGWWQHFNLISVLNQYLYFIALTLVLPDVLLVSLTSSSAGLYKSVLDIFM